MCAAPADSVPIREWQTASERLHQAIDGVVSPISDPNRPTRGRSRRIPVRCTVMCVSIRRLPEGAVGDSVLQEIAAEIRIDRPDHVELGSDRVWAVFNLTDRDYDAPFHVAARVHSLIRILGRTLERRGYPPADASIGLAYGGGVRVAVGTDEVTFAGPMVEEARRLADIDGRGDGFSSGSSVHVSSSLNRLLSPRNRSLLQYRPGYRMYQGNPVNHAMERWISTNLA